MRRRATELGVVAVEGGAQVVMAALQGEGHAAQVCGAAVMSQ